MLTTCHGATLWRNRCTTCGHRQSVAGVPPRQTREQPIWTWPVELIDRRRARRRRRA